MTPTIFILPWTPYMYRPKFSVIMWTGESCNNVSGSGGESTMKWKRLLKFIIFISLEQGNQHHHEGNFHAAKNSYCRAAWIMEYCALKNHEEELERGKILIKLRSNLAQVSDRYIRIWPHKYNVCHHWGWFSLVARVAQSPDRPYEFLWDPVRDVLYIPHDSVVTI